MRGVALGVIAAAALSLAPPGTAPAVAGGATCLGQDVTMVGTPGEQLMGTPGDDVIDGNGAGKIIAGAGDDVICVNGATRRVIVRDGRGDDAIDAREFAGGAIVARLGAGSDDYYGSRRPDFVWSELGGAQDSDLVRTYAGEDSVTAFDEQDVRDVRIDLGPGDDETYFDGLVAVRVFGGTGRDFAAVTCACDHVVARLAAGQLDLDGTSRLVEDVEGVSVGGARSAELFGTAGDNFLGTDACVARVDGRRGNDILSHDNRYGGCVQTSVLRGGIGDDDLHGYNGVDEIYGGRGRDHAYGGGGQDRCRAEVESGCEE